MKLTCKFKQTMPDLFHSIENGSLFFSVQIVKKTELFTFFKVYSYSRFLENKKFIYFFCSGEMKAI